MERQLSDHTLAGIDARPGAAPGRIPDSGLRDRLGARTIVLVGLMGAGKTTIGRRLATRIDLPFRDADAEIEAAAGMPISDIFAIYGERAFRDGERRVISRLLLEGPLVLATGGGAYIDAGTRSSIAQAGVSVWLKADHETLMRRVRKRSHRPLLHTADPDDTMRRLMTDRYPTYALADITIESRDSSHDKIVAEIVAALQTRLDGTTALTADLR